MQPRERDIRRYPTEQRHDRIAGNDAAGPAVEVSVHPDLRAQALLEPVNERELEQAVARLRLVHRDRPAKVFVLCNIPLNLESTTVTTWNALARDREAEACHRWAGVWLGSASERAKAGRRICGPMPRRRRTGGADGKGYQTPLIIT